MIKIVRFIDIGRNKKTWFSEIDLSGNYDADELLIAGEAKRELMSRTVEAAFIDNIHGFVYAGLRCVGTFEIVETI